MDFFRNVVYTVGRYVDVSGDNITSFSKNIFIDLKYCCIISDILHHLCFYWKYLQIHSSCIYFFLSLWAWSGHCLLFAVFVVCLFVVCCLLCLLIIFGRSCCEFVHQWEPAVLLSSVCLNKYLFINYLRLHSGLPGGRFHI